MRGSGWVLPFAALLVWVAAVGYPLIALAGVSAEPTGDVAVRRAAELLSTSAAWAAAIAAGAVVVGWIPGRLLGAALRRRGYLPLAAFMLAPVCVPAYVVFYAWWQAWPADSGLHEWAVRGGHLATARAITLYAGFLCWSWPVVAWCVAGFTASTPASRQELLRLDGAGPMRHLVDRARCDGRGLALGGLVVFLLVFTNTTSFDVAQIFTFGYELSALAALDAGPRVLLRAAAPAVAIAVVGAVVVWRLLGHRSVRAATRPVPVTATAWAVTVVVLVVSVVLPAALFARNLGGDASLSTFVSLYGADLANTVTLAVACGGLAALVAVGLAAAWQDHRRAVRVGADVQAILWLAAGLVPGTIVAVAAEAAYNRPGLDELVYFTPIILVLAYLARFAFVAALLGRWVAMTEPRELRDLRRLEGGTTLTGFVLAMWPRILAAGGAAFAIVGVLSMSELVVTARLGPAGFGVIARGVLNAIHYQRPDTVLLATLALIAIGLAGGLVAAVAWLPLRRFAALCPWVLLLAAFAVLSAGCRRADEGTPAPLEARAAFGSPGLSLGQFNYPRGIAVDRARGFVYVVDKTARVQRYDLSGRPQHQWRMPEWADGKPTGLGVAPDGRVFVADTHYNRVIVYDHQGRELLRFGRYGRGPGEFIYPTDVAFGPDGRIYVSEYGGNERISVFDAHGTYQFSFGSMGSTAGRFNRPQSMTFNADGTELYIADACNHRIVVVTPDGDPLRVIGGPGRGPGQLAYPYDVVMGSDGTLLVCEFGNNRIQRFSADGRSLSMYGRAGTGAGELKYPWGIDGTEAEIFILDSGNNRVQVIENRW